MYRFSLFLTAALVGTSISVPGSYTNALVQAAAAAKSVAEVEAIAKSMAVEIKLKSDPSAVGSGVIIHRQGNLYTLATNRHVVCGSSNCTKVSATELYSLNLPDGQQYRVKAANVRLLGDKNDLDLAIIQFRSDRNYAVAKLAAPGSLQVDDKVYASGFPCESNSDPSIPCRPLGYGFGYGNAIAVVNKRLTGDGGGYTIVYNAGTLPGMSGGGVFDTNGQLVAIHGRGDRFEENTQLVTRNIIQREVGSKIGYNRGIPVRWLVQNLAELDINLVIDRSNFDIRAARPQVLATADEYFIAGFNEHVEPGDNVVAGKLQAIQKLSMAIRLNPRYQYAYFLRAITYDQVKEFQKSLADYNQVILINPKYYPAYYNRALLRYTELNDMQGALTDYNQAIVIEPKYFEAYYNRAVLKYAKLDDIQGALADYNQAILISPKHSSFYYNRAILKDTKLNDIRGALADYNQAIVINPKHSKAYNNRANLKKYNPNDIQEALADYNQAILLNPEYSVAYNNRAILKYENLNDRAGAIQDLRQAARLFREQGRTQDSQRAIGLLQQLGATE